jgi:hypothetical protein
MQVAAVLFAATSALDQSSGNTADRKQWEDLSDDERSKLAQEASGLISQYQQGAAPTAQSDGISSDDPRLKEAIKKGIVEAFCEREQELAQGAAKQEEATQEAVQNPSGAEGTGAAGFHESGINAAD